MEFIRFLTDFILHIDTHLDALIAAYGTVTHGILFLIIFFETGVVVTPFLPGDSLLFAAGAFAARGSLNLIALLTLLSVAAIAGDALNYWIGKKIGAKVFQNNDARIFKKEYLERTTRFYEKYGKKTIVFARFVPIVRTFAPFIAGATHMPYQTFVAYNVGGGLLWVFLFVPAGYFFGNIPFIEKNFSLVILGIIFVSFIPSVVELIRQRKAKKPTEMVSKP